MRERGSHSSIIGGGMGAISPERGVRSAVAVRAAVAGVALGVAAFSGAAEILYDAGGLRVGTTGLIVTFLCALAVGIWAGGPGEGAEPPALVPRWLGSALATAFAGAYGTVLGVLPRLAHQPVGRVLGLLLLAASAYAIGMVLPALAWVGAEWAEALDLPSEGGVAGPLVLGALGGAAGGIALEGLVLLPHLEAGPILIGASVLLLLPLVLPGPAGALAREETLHAAGTPLHELRVTEVSFPGQRQPERRLYLNGEQESGELVRGGAPTLAYVAAAEQWLRRETPAAASYLFLGGGAYTLPRRIAEADSRAAVTVVELDPEVTRAAYEYFGARPEHRMRTVAADARAFLERGAPPASFDRLYVDVYGGAEALPYSLLTTEAFSAMARLLRPGGIAALNVIGTTSGPEAPRLWSIVRTFAAVFPSVALYAHLGPDYPERQNLLLVGAREPNRTFSDRAGFFEPVPRDAWQLDGCAAVFHDMTGDR